MDSLKLAYHDDLLEQAWQLFRTAISDQSTGLNQAELPNQAALRRAVSTAYYSLFHLLVEYSVSNWNNQPMRKTLARAFDHTIMKSASSRILDRKLFPTATDDLRNVANAFCQLQEGRHVADYDLSRDFLSVDALALIKKAEGAFKIWPSIKSDPITQEYLLLLLIRPRKGI
jgi:hypothetical protein